ncbi:unnamed protein product [Brassicogethes aeneus]|uniref:C2H2-type domain-containing protein n=1 Tax=Brassicogethes aeneus TaxID=1431903 RepID=A0A9P0BJ70_BRAAE|nr:unnamed protein product [Brassicogethes aeneus]
MDHVIVHKNIKNFKCPICDKAFRTKQNVAKHLPINSEKWPYKCTLGDKSFKKQSILRKHSFIHLKDRPFKCDVCDKTYKSKESLRVHKLTHNKPKFDCKMCASTFDSLSHLYGHSCRSNKTLKFFICNFCKRGFLKKTLLSIHVRNMHQKVSFTCDTCGILFNRNAKACEYCDLIFYDKKSMENHKKSHLGEVNSKEDLLCTICNKQFEFPKYLKAHLKQHEDSYKKYK